jgi:hypothetical protein
MAKESFMNTANDLVKSAELTALGVPAQSIVSCDDIACETLVDPIPRPSPPPFTVHVKPAIPQVLLVDNDKPNSMRILKATQAVLKKRGVDVRDEIPIKENAGKAMPAAMLDKLATERALVICGVND